MNDTPTQTIADALLLLSLGNDNEIGKDASERLMKLERENAALLLKIQDLELQNNAMRSTSRGKEVAKNKKLERENAALREKLQIEGERSMYWRENENRLKTENAALRADKDRLDWLESRLNSSYVELCHYGNGSQLDGDAARAYDRTKPYYVDGQFGRSGASLRDAIDAARKEEQP